MPAVLAAFPWLPLPLSGSRSTRRQHQWCLRHLLLGRLTLEQPLRGRHQHELPLPHPQKVDDLRVPLQFRSLLRRPALFVGDADVGASGHQLTHTLVVAKAAGDVERRAPVFLDRVDCSGWASGEQQLDHVNVAASARAVK